MQRQDFSKVDVNEPKIIFAGDKAEWTESNSDYLPSAGWTLKYVLINSTTKISFSSTPDGDSHSISLSSAVTAAYTSGVYTMQPYFENTGGTKEMQPRLTVEIKPDLTAAGTTTYDFRTHARKTLDLIEDAIEGRADKAHLSLQVSTPQGSRALQYMNMEEMIKAREYYRGLVAVEEQQEKIDAGQNPGGRIKLQFSD